MNSCYNVMNYLKFYIVAFFISLVAYAQVSTTQISFRSLTVDQGLSQNSVKSIAQDSTGYIWFNTEDGLNKYDGKEFTYYNVYIIT